jgi:chorismate mutase/prephenate dehydrogenase
MAYVLGLSHAVNIAFFNALMESGEDAAGLARLSSRTFDAQLDVASHVARENPYLYFEVQSLNAHSPRALISLLNAVTQVAGRVLDRDEAGFVALMEQGKAFLARRPEDRP